MGSKLRLAQRVDALALPGGLDVPDGHQHRWVRFSDALGLFHCRDFSCLWCAVCPGCLRSLQVALLAHQGIAGEALYWCSAHNGGGEHAD